MRLKFSEARDAAGEIAAVLVVREAPRFRVEYRLGLGAWQFLKSAHTADEARAHREMFYRTNSSERTFARLTPQARILDLETGTVVV